MKKLLIFMWVFLLVGCGLVSNFDGTVKVYDESDVIDLTDFNLETLTGDEIEEKLGVADRYGFDNEIYDVNDLPSRYIMTYGDDVAFFIMDNKILEMRIMGPDVIYKNLYSGQSQEEAIALLNEPEDVLDGYHLYFKYKVLYTNTVDSFDGKVGYYHDDENRVRLWLHEGIVSSVYYTTDLFYRYEDIFYRGDGENTEYYLAYRGNKDESKGDDQLKGTWRYMDYVYDVEEFSPNRRLSDQEFIDLQIADNGIVLESYLYWETGKLISVNHPLREIYTYEYLTLEDDTYLVVTTDSQSLKGYWIFIKE